MLAYKVCTIETPVDAATGVSSLFTVEQTFYYIPGVISLIPFATLYIRCIIEFS